MKVSLNSGINTLERSNNKFVQLFSHGTLEVELYKPEGKDLQQPHDRDEVYMIVNGHGEFYHEGEISTFESGDVYFVPAGEEHRFQNFSSDFMTWVFFYGPVGGE